MPLLPFSAGQKKLTFLQPGGETTAFYIDSPDGSQWTCTIDNSGNLSCTKASTLGGQVIGIWPFTLTYAS